MPHVPEQVLNDLGIWSDEYSGLLSDPEWPKLDLTEKLTVPVARKLMKSAEGQGLQIYSFEE